MRIDERQRAKLNRVLGYGGVAIVVVWTITAIALYAATSALSGWLDAATFGNTAWTDWSVWTGQVIGDVGGVVIAILWLAVTLAILGFMTGLRRLIRG